MRESEGASLQRLRHTEIAPPGQRVTVTELGDAAEEQDASEQCGDDDDEGIRHVAILTSGLVRNLESTGNHSL